MSAIILSRIKKRWNREAGYRDLLVVALPLIISTSSWTIQHFVDRMFLTWYSVDAIAASMPAGMLNFTIMSLFLGTATYVSTFIAQYFGAGRYERIGPAMWQGVHVALLGGIVHLCVIPFAPFIFNSIGHAPEVAASEIIYFQVLCTGAFPALASAAFSGFFSGMGKTQTVMWVNLFATGVNLLFDYALIFGHWGFPELGIKGAGIATVISGCSSFTAYLVVLLKPANRIRYALKKILPEKELFVRLMKFGLPGGVQFCLDVAGFSVFLLIIGRLGAEELAATNIAFNINILAFMPMIGMGMAVSIFVGQYLGRDDARTAEYSVYSGFHIAFLYIFIIVLLYLFIPDILVYPFSKGASADEFGSIRGTVLVLIRFVALYSLFDTFNIIFASAIKGAGDTKFVMYIIVAASLFALVIPAYIAIEIASLGIYAAWSIASIYVIVMGLSFFMRFRTGRWKSMRVIERVPVIPPSYPDTPVTCIEP